MTRGVIFILGRFVAHMIGPKIRRHIRILAGIGLELAFTGGSNLVPRAFPLKLGEKSPRNEVVEAHGEEYHKRKRLMSFAF